MISRNMGLRRIVFLIFGRLCLSNVELDFSGYMLVTVMMHMCSCLLYILPPIPTRRGI